MNRIGMRPCSWITDNPELNKRWNPCGMIMEYLPSGCYKRQAIVFDDGGTATLIWYPCSPIAKPFPFPHGFGSLSSVQTYGIYPTVVGELDVPRTWIQDKQLPYAGQVFCGQADWYVNGVPRAVLSLPAPPCPGCAALAGLGALLVQDFVNNVALLGGPYDCSYSVDYARLCP